MVVVRDGELVREFLDDPSAPEQNVNRGVSDSEYEPFNTWVDVAGFVDKDDLGFCERGWLWVWPRQADQLTGARRCWSLSPPADCDRW